MPNWTRNRVIMDGLENSVLIRKDKDNFPIVDFNGVIPMPKELADAEEGSYEERAVLFAVATFRKVVDTERVFGFFDIPFSVDTKALVEAKKWIKDYELSEDKVLADGLNYIHNALTYGYLTWYRWAIDNWGTKWNASEEDVSVCDDIAEFETAWSAPLPVVKKLSELYPDREVTIEWAYDSGDSTGCITYKNGKQISGGEDTDIKDIRSTYESVWGYELDFLDEEEEAK